MSVSVIKPATAKILTTAANVRADLGLGAASPTEQQLARWIEIASARVITHCRRQFARETVREEICLRRSADGGDGILFDRWPFVAAESVSLDGIVLDPTDYQADDRRIYRVRGGARECWRGRKLVVVYEAGWFLPPEEGDAPEGVQPLPPDVEHAVALLVAGSVYASGRDVTVKSEDVEGVGEFSYYVQSANAALPNPEAEAILKPYRRARVG